jgi:hypothetical protein
MIICNTDLSYFNRRLFFQAIYFYINRPLRISNINQNHFQFYFKVGMPFAATSILLPAFRVFLSKQGENYNTKMLVTEIVVYRTSSRFEGGLVKRKTYVANWFCWCQLFFYKQRFQVRAAFHFGLRILFSESGSE